MNPFDRPQSYSPCIEDVLYWVAEREEIRRKKENGASAPYTDDPILAKYRFCNVRRRDDRMTRWFMENIYRPYLEEGGEDLWFIAAIARHVNWPPTLLSLLVNGGIPKNAKSFDPYIFSTILEDLKNQGLKIWGGAYVIYPGRETGTSKAETVAFRFLLPMTEHVAEIKEVLNQKSVEKAVNAISKFWGVSTFIAGQIVSDLTYYPQELGEAKDLYTWAPIGPGSSNGLNLLLERAPTASWKQSDFNKQLQYIWKEVVEQLDLEQFTLHDQQNVMCEMSKYWRVLNNKGRPRSLYTPETSY